MAHKNSSWQLATSILSVLVLGTLCVHTALGQYTYVQDVDSVGAWDDVANWDTDNEPSTPNTTYPNGVGVTAQINQPVWGGLAGTYTLDMPTTDVTLGQLTIDNTGDNYAKKINMINHGGRLIFEDSSGTAKYNETANGTTTDAPQNVQNSIQVPIWVKNTLEITQNNYKNLNTGTIFTNRFDGDINSVMIKKGVGGIQFNNQGTLSGSQGFFGQILIQEGAIRAINKTVTLSTVSGVTVTPGGQLQLADNLAVPVTDYNLGVDGIGNPAVLKISGNGTLAPSSDPQGALRFGIFVTTPVRTMTFHNPVLLEGDSTISAGGVGNTGRLEKPVTGPFGLTKEGDGKLVIMDPLSSWGGDTHVLTAPTATGSSVLSLPGPILANGKDLYVSATRSAIDLSFTGTDTIRSFFIDGAEQLTGTWGAIGAVALGANHESSLITGTGWLNVTGAGLAGDYNGDLKVDAADYVSWRMDPGAHGGDPGGYNAWRANFGTGGSGSSLGGSGVPEPSTFLSFALVAPFLTARRLGWIRK